MTAFSPNLLTNASLAIIIAAFEKSYVTPPAIAENAKLTIAAEGTSSIPLVLSVSGNEDTSAAWIFREVNTSDGRAFFRYWKTSSLDASINNSLESLTPHLMKIAALLWRRVYASPS